MWPSSQIHCVKCGRVHCEGCADLVREAGKSVPGLSTDLHAHLCRPCAKDLTSPLQ